MCVAAALIFVASVTMAQNESGFATKGCVELGGSISFQSTTPVSDGSTSDAIKTFSLAPFVGYFVTDGFELGFNPFGIESISYTGASVTQIMIFVAPSYNFKTEGKAYPFIEALFGYTSSSNGSSRNGFSWGGRGGVKVAVTGNGLLNLGVQYVQIALNPSGAAKRDGSNQLAISAGFTVWL
jgi:hypothetical protein